MTTQTRFLSATVLVCLSLLAVVSPLLGLSLKLISDLYAVGDSFTKVHLSLLFFALVLTVPSWPWADSLTKPLSIVLVTLLLVAQGEQFYLMHQLGLPWTNTVNIVSQGDFAGTRLDHVHVAKAMVGQVLGKMDYRFDGGIPFVPYFPPGWLWGQLALFLFASGASLATLARAREQRPLTEWGRFALANFIVLKNCIDGGALNPELIAVVPLYLQGVWGGSLRSYAVPVWGVYGLLLSLTPLLRADHFFRFVTTLLAILLVGLVLQNRRWWLVVAVAALAFPAGRYWLLPQSRSGQSAYNMVFYHLTPLASGQVIYMVRAGAFESNSLAEIETVERAGPYYLARARMLRPGRIYTVCRAFDLHTQRSPVLLGPRRDLLITITLKLPGRPFETHQLRFPAGTNVNFMAASLPEGAVFRQQAAEATGFW